jgi:hypothetical protein
MASQWFRQIEGGEEGPFAFEQLAELIRSGELAREAFVRRAEQREWQRVDQVVGLLRSARRSAAPVLAAPDSRTVDEPPPVQSPVRSRLTTPLSKRQLVRKGIPAAVSAVTLAVAMSWWFTRPRQPPSVSSARLEFAIPSRVEQMRPKLPGRPTIGNLPDADPVPIPGLENIPWLSAPTLDDPMTTLVFVGVGPPETSDDLFIAQRASVNDRFGRPTVIATCSGPAKEGYPALSADGLELIYAELATPNHRLMHSHRPDRTATFGPSRPLEIEGEALADLHIDGAQFLGPNRIRFAAGDVAYTQRTQWVAERAGPEKPFRTVMKLPLANPWPRYFLAAGGQRVYYADTDGIFITVGDSTGREYVTPEKLLPSSVTGPVGKFDSPIWIAPQEDVLVFCSPGVDTPDAPDHRLWMIQLSGKP